MILRLRNRWQPLALIKKCLCGFRAKYSSPHQCYVGGQLFKLLVSAKLRYYYYGTETHLVPPQMTALVILCLRDRHTNDLHTHKLAFWVAFFYHQRLFPSGSSFPFLEPWPRPPWRIMDNTASTLTYCWRLYENHETRNAWGYWRRRREQRIQRFRKFHQLGRKNVQLKKQLKIDFSQRDAVENSKLCQGYHIIVGGRQQATSLVGQKFVICNYSNLFHRAGII